ncbi:hypothetical protein RhiirA4_494351 [Rhizophagus irregularis]|uniref:Uncharacterized protein n=1 Tax=Rhizophagus irregularis TaxID=588596 RepID=A0A2I1G1Q3_9GLOM|nr:hypothetical protein RhiirA4_494351 [Rhizophagus irregularis]
MFLIDSCSCRKTEPTWFGVFRCGFAFVLTCIILKFSAYDNFNKIFRQSILEQVDVPKDSVLVIETSMCANDAMEVYKRSLPLSVLNVRKNITSDGRCMSFPIPIKIPDFASRERVELDVQSEQLPLNLDTNRIGLGFYIYYPFRYKFANPYDFASYLSDIGGFYGSIEGFFASIFGSGKLEPWGIAQIFILTSIPCVRSFGRNFAKVYVSKGGIPLVEDVKDRPRRNEEFDKSLEERVQILETLLKEYYLDEHYLEKIKYFADSRKKLKEDEEKAKKEMLLESRRELAACQAAFIIPCLLRQERCTIIKAKYVPLTDSAEYREGMLKKQEREKDRYFKDYYQNTILLNNLGSDRYILVEQVGKICGGRYQAVTLEKFCESNRKERALSYLFFFKMQL